MHELTAKQGLPPAVLDPAGQRPATALDIGVALSDRSPDTLVFCCKPRLLSAEVP